MPYPVLNPDFRSRQANRRQRQRGLTLIELMVSLTIGLILVAGLTLLFAQQSATQGELEKSSRQIENGRYAMQVLREDLQLAGYYGEFYNMGAMTVPTTMPAPCLSSAAQTNTTSAAVELIAGMPFPVQGYDAPSGALPTSLANCLISASNHLAGTDILVVRHAETKVEATTGLKVWQTYLQSGLTSSMLELKYALGIATGANIADTRDPLDSTKPLFGLIKRDGTPAPLRKYSVHVYYISPCSVPTNGSTCSSTNTDDGGVSVPTLKRLELVAKSGSVTFDSVPLVEGIENMQIDYGFDSNGDGAPDSYATDAAAVGDWANVMAVRVHLLARNNERSAGYKDDKTYNLGLHGGTAATNDGFKRHVFSQMIRVVNPSARRDQ